MKKKGNNSKIGNQISDIINGFWVITKNGQFSYMFYF
jgi:hypothetical protein